MRWADYHHINLAEFFTNNTIETMSDITIPLEAILRLAKESGMTEDDMTELVNNVYNEKPTKKAAGKKAAGKKAEKDASESGSGSESASEAEGGDADEDVSKMSVGDLKELCKKRKVKVVAAGARVVKADYLKALGVKDAKAPAKKTASKAKAPAKKGKAPAKGKKSAKADEEQDLEKLKLGELKELCKEREYSGYSSLKKAELIAFIESGGKTKPKASTKGAKKAPAKGKKAAAGSDDDSAPDEEEKESGSGSSSSSSSDSE